MVQVGGLKNTCVLHSTAALVGGAIFAIRLTSLRTYCMSRQCFYKVEANVDPSFTCLVWQKLEQQVRAHFCWQICLTVHLLTRHVRVRIMELDSGVGAGGLETCVKDKSISST